jgi:hypothetical protein
MDITRLRTLGDGPKSVDDFLTSLGIDHYAPHNGEIEAHCPFHEDLNPSFSINEESGAWICHAGCGSGSWKKLVTQILEPLKAQEFISSIPVGLFQTSSVNGSSSNGSVPFWPPSDELYEPAPSHEDEYNYRTEDGEHYYAVRRRIDPRGHKTFTTGRYINGAWSNIDPNQRIPYRHPELGKAIQEETPIYITEGEKDADAIAGLFGVATTFRGGKWHDEYRHYLKGGHFIIVADRDDDPKKPGLKNALKIYEGIKDIAASVRIVGAKVGKDAADHIHNGYTLDDFVPYEPRRSSQSQSPTGTESESSLVLTEWAEVEMEPLQWLFEGWIPDNYLTLFAGDGGIGKSTFLIGLAAILSKGRDPKVNKGIPANTIILSAEDGIAETGLPRALAANADVSRISSPNVQVDDWLESLSFPEDRKLLAEAIQRKKAKLVILDPGNAYINVENAHVDADLRRALKPLAEVAQQCQCAIVFLIHLNKNKNAQQSFRDRINGSVGNVNAARSVLGMARHPENEDEIVLAHVKHNYSAAQGSLVFRIEEVSLRSKNDRPLKTTKMVKIGESDLTADDLVAPKERGNPKLDAAIAFIWDQLETGPMVAKDFNKAALLAKISDGTMAQAKKYENVITKKIAGVYYVGIEDDILAQSQSPIRK